MSYKIKSKCGEQLWRYLPAVYRTRDKDGHLAAYLDAFGGLLDRIRNTLEQQLADVFPDLPDNPEARRCQAWIVPYLGDLVAASVLSPEEDGQREEVANAIRWRQRKGTLVAAEEIAEKVGQIEVQLHEGWKRTATTARVQFPLISASFFGITDELLPVLLAQEQAAPPSRNPLVMAFHPGIPLGTVDFRRTSRAIEAASAEVLAQATWFDGIRVWWKQRGGAGAPCFPARGSAMTPGSFEDQTPRTIDVRDPRWNQGHFHPRRLLIYHAPPRGVWRPEEVGSSSPGAPGPIQLEWQDPLPAEYARFLSITHSAEFTKIVNATTRPLEITGQVVLNKAASYLVENLRFADEVVVPSATVELRRVEARRFVVDLASQETGLTAADSLFDELVVGSARAVLQRCTTLTRANLYGVEAENCLFPEDLQASTPETERGELYAFSHCRVPAAILASKFTTHCTSDLPLFFSGDYQANDGAVLRPDSPASITLGSSAGKEMGCFHDGRIWPVRVEHLVPLSIPPGSSYALADVVVAGTLEITGGVLRLERAAIDQLVVASPEGAQPVLEARSCVFRVLSVPQGLGRLEYCTVLGEASLARLQASDCVFAGPITGSPAATSGPSLSPASALPTSLCLRYSRIPPEVGSLLESEGRTVSSELAFGTNTTKAPVFYESTIGLRGVGVLHPATPETICAGAEDGGEMGAYHDSHFCLRARAVIQKLFEFLPVGLIPVLVPDRRLLTPPPAIQENLTSP